MIFNQKKYHFNKVTLTYEEIKIKKGTSLLKYSALIFSFCALAFVSGYLLEQEFGSGESWKLEARIDSLSQEMALLYQTGTEYSHSLKSDIFLKDNRYRLILELDTIPYPIRNAGSGGSAALYISGNKDLTYRINDLISSLNQQLQIQSNSYAALYDKALLYSAANSHIPAIQPVTSDDLIMIGSVFGMRNDPFIYTEKYHYGLDFVTAPGKNVFATGDGIVTFVRHSRTGYGNEIVIDHNFGFGTRYGHLNSMNVKEGDMVKRGQIIGTVGATGRATGPHLHYEVLYNNQPVNPAYYFDSALTREEFAQIINRANETTN